MPLTGKTIFITRPKEQCATLAAAISEQGGIPVTAPLLAITGITNSPTLNKASEQLSSYRMAIFISPNSVEHSLPTLLKTQTWPPHLQAAAIGPGTQKTLTTYGIVDCLLPRDTQYDSEGLLARDEFQAPAIAGQSILLLRGEGGRELLADTLAARGAHVTAIACYQRTPPNDLAQPFEAAWGNNQLDGILLSSSEGLSNLLSALPPNAMQQLIQTPLFVPHSRIAERARSAGLKKVILTPPAEEGMLSGLLTYNWPIA